MYRFLMNEQNIHTAVWYGIIIHFENTSLALQIGIQYNQDSRICGKLHAIGAWYFSTF